MVEAPGTAPGSDRLITEAIYCHSHISDKMNIGCRLWERKGGNENHPRFELLVAHSSSLLLVLSNRIRIGKISAAFEET